MSDAMSSSDTRRNCAPEAGATEALRPTVSLLLLTVSMVPRQLELDAVCSGRFRDEGRMYYVAKKRVKAHSLRVKSFSPPPPLDPPQPGGDVLQSVALLS